ncbi:MATE family efflux transporter [Holdemania massiliensis]|uniref:Probable multidrug resistance protein NorM n=1 Tax=Holdemania massiliensis TaxID=1468449 RepID=A0A6N7S9E2_9FIRM|nr:MATE family efflux transporter [Holdemania massiliensis]MSA71974.1 MATE family efflux transporter [Holdemania massiliensis]MSA90250.1 MATE family efflux transporter [Holdemania massiliensis]MSB79056.1 MATE family efflux transporter [Holdemania massiliensis]MSC33980.1 MATE family efflux transporter [Holdemania massiliensis]MSC40370.1 MATE family efflux transporter [Holdemania massiliensis]
MAGGTAQLALDRVEAGENLEITKTRKTLPEGITRGMLMKDVLRIAGPSFVELTLTQLTSMADLMMVGQLGAWAITSVGLTTQPKFLMMTMFMAMNVGATALVARYKGAEQPGKANETVRQALMLTLIMSIAASLAGFFFSETMVRFMGATDELSLVNGTIYLQIQMAGFVLMALTTTITALLRGVGDSKTAMKYNVTANVVNIVLNWILIYGNLGFPKMGVAGASLATVIGQTAAFLMAAWALMKKGGYLEFHLLEKYHIDKEILGNIFAIGLPAMVEQLFMRFGVILYSKTVASLGTVAFATHNICMNIQALSFMIGQGFAVSSTSLVGQSLGKKRTDMAHHYGKVSQQIGIGFSLILALIFFVIGGPIVALYSNEAEVIEQGTRILMFLALIQPFQATQFILAGVLRGAGDTKTTAVVIFVTTLIVRPLLAILTVYELKWGLYGAWIALVADQLLRTLLIWLRYRSGKWQLMKLRGEQA